MQCHPSWSVRDHSCLEYSWLMQNNVKEISLYFSWVVGNEESCPGSSVLSTDSIIGYHQSVCVASAICTVRGWNECGKRSRLISDLQNPH